MHGLILTYDGGPAPGNLGAEIRFGQRWWSSSTSLAYHSGIQGYKQMGDGVFGGRLMVTLAGAMSTAEIGRSLAPMIRAGKIHAITCTGANLEEDVFKLVAHSKYQRIPNWRNLTEEDEEELQ